MSVITWLKNRRTKSRYADDKAVEGFTRVAKEHGLLPPMMTETANMRPIIANMNEDAERIDRLAKLLQDDTNPAGNLEEIAKLLGQSKP